MNGFLVFLQQAGTWLAGQAGQMWDVASAVASNHSEPAGRVAMYTLALAVLLLFVPKIVKKVTR